MVTFIHPPLKMSNVRKKVILYNHIVYPVKSVEHIKGRNDEITSKGYIAKLYQITVVKKSP